MTTLTATRSPTHAAQRARLFDPGDARTLEDSLTAVSETLALRGTAHCLVCGATLVRSAGDYAGTPEAIAACGACGSSLE
jgi:hypothetical protein